MNYFKNISIFLFSLFLISLYFISFAQIQINTTQDATLEGSNTQESSESLRERTIRSSEDNKSITHDFIKIPKSTFANPLSGVVQVNGEVSRGDRVAFFIKGEVEGTDIYLGSSPVKANKFSFEIDSKNIPNGTYSLIVKIIVSHRNVHNEIFPIKIFNSAPPPPEDIVKEVKEAKQEVQENQELLDTKKEEIEEIISNIDPSLVENDSILNDAFDILNSEKDAILKSQDISSFELQKEEIKKLISKIDTEIRILERAGKDSAIVDQKIINKLKDEKIFIKQDLEKRLLEIEKAFDDSREELQKLKQEMEAAEKELLESINDESSKERITSEFEKRKEKIREAADSLLEKRKVLVSDDDGDGLPNEFEVRIGTNPKAADSDNDGIIDAVEYVNGLNPLKSSPKERIVYKDPREVKPINSGVFQVKSVKIDQADKESEQEKTLVIKGKALPNSFVTVYIYSPIILLAKADSEGNWEVKVDREVEDGDHEVYVALTDNKGDILARSEPFVFKKVKDEIVVIDANVLAANFVSPSKQVESRFLALTIISVLIGLGIVFIILGLRTKRT